MAVPKRKMSRSNTRSRRAMEGDRGRDRGLPAVQVAEAAARRLLRLRHLQRPPGPRGLTWTPSDAPDRWSGGARTLAIARCPGSLRRRPVRSGRRSDGAGHRADRR